MSLASCVQKPVHGLLLTAPMASRLCSVVSTGSLTSVTEGALQANQGFPYSHPCPGEHLPARHHLWPSTTNPQTG